MEVTLDVYWILALVIGCSFIAFVAGRLIGEGVQIEQYNIYSGGRSLAELYQELLMQVGNKYANETRHQKERL